MESGSSGTAEGSFIQGQADDSRVQLLADKGAWKRPPQVRGQEPGSPLEGRRRHAFKTLSEEDCQPRVITVTQG